MRSMTAHWSLIASLVLAIVLVGGAIGGLVVPAASQTESDAQTSNPVTELRIELQSDGTAHWTVAIRFTLDSPNESRAFERMATEYMAGSNEILSLTPFQEAVEQAGSATDREMEIMDTSRSADQVNDTGSISLSFTWSNFARVNGDRLELGDVFKTESGTWLPGLTENQELIIEFPPEYGVLSSSRRVQNGTFDISGPVQFEPGEPSAVLIQQRGGITRNGGTDGSDGTDSTSSPPNGGAGGLPLIGIGTTIVIIVALVYLLQRRSQGTINESNSVGSKGPDSIPEDSDEGQSSVESVVEEELLSDEERVLQLLGKHGGRMKQAAIVEATDWSNAKVSQLLSEMDEHEQIEKLRLGRENIISLPDDSPNDGD